MRAAARLGAGELKLAMGRLSRAKEILAEVWAQVLRLLYEHRIGIEVMDTSAACRTYNVLLGEGRRVAAALIPVN